MQCQCGCGRDISKKIFGNIGVIWNFIEFSHSEIAFVQRDGRRGDARVSLAIPWAEPRFGHAVDFLLWCVIQLVPSGAHTGTDRERERDYNIHTRLCVCVSLLSASPSRVDLDSKAETNFADFSIAGKDACHRATYCYPLPLLTIWRVMRVRTTPVCFYKFFIVYTRF